MHVVVVGNGPAAIGAIEALRETDPLSPITLISRESYPFYSPCPLAEYVEESVARRDLFLKAGDFYLRHKITTLMEHSAVSLDAASRVLRAKGGGCVVDIPYDRLLIASGARPVMPPVHGLGDTPGVFPLKTLDDADGIITRLGMTQSAVVIGSGFIGLEAAQALSRRGVAVTVVEALDQVLPMMLDAEFAAHVRDRLLRFGVDVLLSSPVRAVLGGARGVRSVLAGEREIDCQLVITAAGVRPDVAWLGDSGLAMGRGIIVNDRMETNLPDVYAAGDIIETSNWMGASDVVPTWPNAVATGRTAGHNIAGHERHFQGLVAVNVVRIFGQAVSSFGARFGERTLSVQTPETFRRLFLDKGRIVGGQFIGNVDGSGIYLELMRKGIDVSAVEDVLLSPRFTPARLLPAPPVPRVAVA
ncbi:FAD-dependent oxidoreductase [Ferrimicrobium sp.]|uniref:NAD(P)/FAD-dependent oxidoreductase n=1 Tax=Ferrimicrobium sp. TaxID=2926050 RepID=UPI0026393A41|nr:FAD-dependent oxidoreductase [Ferrimicrobium sp.]